jgi:hypothetical protein
MAREYIIIGGSIPGTNPDGDDDKYSMSKKERRWREREEGAANFKSGNNKKKKTTSVSIDYERLEQKVHISLHQLYSGTV